mmetsp:Transcript_30532/g.46803  ORF Transcript_30532/g.46803 Transcript_30532/m.46803 type:complete len:214 (+) Transcript_30532:645-1286(+)
MHLHYPAQVTFLGRSSLLGTTILTQASYVSCTLRTARRVEPDSFVARLAHGSSLLYFAPSLGRAYGEVAVVDLVIDFLPFLQLLEADDFFHLATPFLFFDELLVLVLNFSILLLNFMSLLLEQLVLLLDLLPQFPNLVPLFSLLSCSIQCLFVPSADLTQLVVVLQQLLQLAVVFFGEVLRLNHFVIVQVVLKLFSYFDAALGDVFRLLQGSI